MAKNFVLHDQSESPIGETVLHFDVKPSIPAQFRPIARISTSEARNGSNINVKIALAYPLARQVDGVWTAKNTFRANFSFTALQNEVEDVVRETILVAMIDLLTTQKDRIKTGSSVFNTTTGASILLP